MQLQYARRAPAQNVSTRHNGPRPETRPDTHGSETEMRPSRWGFCTRRDRDELVRLETVSRPRRLDRDHISVFNASAANVECRSLSSRKQCKIISKLSLTCEIFWSDGGQQQLLTRMARLFRRLRLNRLSTVSPQQGSVLSARSDSGLTLQRCSAVS